MAFGTPVSDDTTTTYTVTVVDKNAQPEAWIKYDVTQRSAPTFTVEEREASFQRLIDSVRSLFHFYTEGAQVRWEMNQEVTPTPVVPDPPA